MASDPPRIADFWLDARLLTAPSAVVYLGHANDQGEVMILLLSRGAAADAAARDRLAGEVNKLHADTVIARGGQDQNTGRLGYKYRSEDDDPVSDDMPEIAPWVALAYDGSPAAAAEATRLVTAIDLSTTPSLGKVAGPGFSLGWTTDTRGGLWRLWPLSWPGRHDRAGWLPLFVSWLLMLTVCGLGLLIAVLIFQNEPPETPQPPISQLSATSGFSPDPSGSYSTESPDPSDSASSSSDPSDLGTDMPTGDTPSMSDPSSSGSANASANPSSERTRL